MKKLLVKIKVIDTPYFAAVDAVSQKWTKEEIVVFEQPMIEVDGVLVNDESYTYHAEIPAIPEVLEVSHEEIIAQTQGTDDQLTEWLAGDSFKYPEGYWVEYVDISAQVAFNQAVLVAYAEITKGMKGLAVFKVKVKEKALTTNQIAQIFSDPAIQKIISTLSTGSLPLAAMLIAAYPADGVIITEEDKAAVLSAIA
jgi:hypothetical protein